MDVGLQRRSRVCAGGEVEVLAILVEHRVSGVTHAIGELCVFSLVNRIEKDAAQVARKSSLISQPAAIGRPSRRRSAEGPEDVMIYFDGLLLFHVDVPNAEVVVAVGDLFAVGRPARREKEACSEADLLHLAGSILVADMERILPAFVGKVCDCLSIGRPGRIALHHRRAVGEVALVALFSRDGEDFAMRLENCTRAGRRNVGVLEALSHVHEVIANLKQVAGYPDIHLLRGAGVQIVEMQRAKLLVNNGIRSGGS